MNTHILKLLPEHFQQVYEAEGPISIMHVGSNIVAGDILVFSRCDVPNVEGGVIVKAVTLSVELCSDAMFPEDWYLLTVELVGRCTMQDVG